jgi:alpha-amylase
MGNAGIQLKKMSVVLAALASLAAAAFSAGCGGGGGAGGNDPPVVNPPVLPTVDRSTVAAADPGSPLPEGWAHGGVMQVFVRSYQDSNGDGIGDFRGLRQRLPYLKALGVRGLWLLPITQSEDGDHGYAVANYRATEAAYGSLADFDDLVREARAQGIGILIDHVMNHSASSNAAFVNAVAASDNVYRDWYIFQPTAPTGWSIYGGNPWRSSASGAYFAPFSAQMPDMNLRNTAVIGWHHDHLRFWLNRGVAGFRFDAVGNFIENGASAWENQPENDAVLAGARALIQGYARGFMVCEGPSAPLRYGRADVCGSAFAFGLQGPLLRAAQGDGAALAEVGRYFETAPLTMATFLSNHDSFAGARVADQLDGRAAQMKLAATMLLTLPGVPFIYYGEEIGLRSPAALSGDPRLRTPMSWTADTTRAGFTTGTPYRALAGNVATANVAAQETDADSLLNHYKAMLALRASRESLLRGSYAVVQSGAPTLGFTRTLGSEQSLVVLNVSTASTNVALSGLTPNARYRPLLPALSPAFTADADGRATVAVPAQGVRVLARD